MGFTGITNTHLNTYPLRRQGWRWKINVRGKCRVVFVGNSHTSELSPLIRPIPCRTVWGSGLEMEFRDIKRCDESER